LSPAPFLDFTQDHRDAFLRLKLRAALSQGPKKREEAISALTSSPQPSYLGLMVKSLKTKTKLLTNLVMQTDSKVQKVDDKVGQLEA